MIKQYMAAMGVKEAQYQNGDFEVTSPIDGSVIGSICLLYTSPSPRDS